MMLLLDTHILLWAAHTPAKLSTRARQLLEASTNTLVFSAASIWEVAIKASLDRPGFTVVAGQLRRGLIEAGYIELDITTAHAAAVSDLPPLHRDPFDRMLVAQAHVEGLTLLTTDAQVAQYGAGVTLV